MLGVGKKPVRAENIPKHTTTLVGWLGAEAIKAACDGVGGTGAKVGAAAAAAAAVK